MQGGHLQALHEFLSERIESCCSEQRNVDDELEDIFPTNLTGNHVGRNYKPNRLDDANQIAEKIVLKAEFNEFSLQEQKIEIDHIVSIQVSSKFLPGHSLTHLFTYGFVALGAGLLLHVDRACSCLLA